MVEIVYMKDTYPIQLANPATAKQLSLINKFVTFVSKSLGVFTFSILSSIVTILIRIVVILASTDPILEKCVYPKVQYSQVL